MYYPSLPPHLARVQRDGVQRHEPGQRLSRRVGGAGRAQRRGARPPRELLRQGLGGEGVYFYCFFVCIYWIGTRLKSLPEKSP